ncbi:MAG: hypothetical protein KAJ19_28915 [Gammaproteobacteria bacterium]|nr:hypothetical protein [Gammaproteobacteria bacterium]
MAKKKVRKKRVVKNVNWYVDEHYKLKMKRDALEKRKKEVISDIEKLEGEALNKFGKEGIEGAKGKKATGFIQELDHYNVADRRKLDAYVKRTGNFELFQNRVSGDAVQDIEATNKRFKRSSAGIGLYTSTHFRTRKR